MDQALAKQGVFGLHGPIDRDSTSIEGRYNMSDAPKVISTIKVS